MMGAQGPVLFSARQTYRVYINLYISMGRAPFFAPMELSSDRYIYIYIHNWERRQVNNLI